MNARILALTLFLLCYGGVAFAAPPLITDDTGTPGDKNWEINIAFAVDNRHNETSYSAPILDFNYGVGEHIQLKYEVPWVVLHERGNGTKNGLGNSLVGVKWRFIDEDKHGMDMSVYPQVEFNNPTSSVRRGLVTRGTDVLLPLQAAKNLGPVEVVAEVGYTLKQHTKDGWLYGVIVRHKLLDNLTVMGEIHGESDKTLSENEVVFNIGGQWDFSKRFGLLASAGRSFKSGTSGAPNLLIYLGLQLRL